MENRCISKIIPKEEESKVFNTYLIEWVCGGIMNIIRLVAGLVFLAMASIVFYFMPPLSITSKGVEEVYYVNIAVAVALSIVGISLLLTGIKSREVSIKFD